MVSTEMFRNELKEFFPYVYHNIQAEGWIKPNHLISISCCILEWFLEFQCCLVSTLFKWHFVRNLSFVKVSIAIG